MKKKIKEKRSVSKKVMELNLLKFQKLLKSGKVEIDEGEKCVIFLRN